MTQVPVGWTDASLGQLAEFIMGQAPPGADCNKSGRGTPFVKAGEFGPERPVIREWTMRPLKLAQKGDVLICVVGATSGKINLGADCAIGRSVAAIRPLDALSQRYLYEFLSTKILELRSGSVGTAQGVISRDDLANIEIPLAPLPEQRRIVAKIDSLTAKSKRARDQLDRIPRLVDRYKQTILAAAFTGELTREWRQRNRDIDLPLDRLREIRRLRAHDRKLSRRKRADAFPDATLPRTWQWISSDEIADDSEYSIGIGPFGSNLLRTDYRQHGVRLIFVRDIIRERFDAFDARYITDEKAAELHQHVVKGGDVLITKMGEPPGDTALYPLGSPPAIITADCIKLRPHQKLADATYLTYCIRSKDVGGQIKQITKGVAHQKVSLDGFRSVALPISPLAEQIDVVRRIKTAFAWIDRLASEATSARELIDHLDQAILAKAFRGELVPQEPNDEPASVLLERIRAERQAASVPRLRNEQQKARKLGRR